MHPVGNDAVSLHYVWDSAIQRSQNMADVEKTATHLRSVHPPGLFEEMHNRPYRGPDSFARWILEESHPLAIGAAYRDGRLAGAPDKKKATRLAEDYIANARTIAARRMAMSGYRLAEILRAIFP